MKTKAILSFGILAFFLCLRAFSQDFNVGVAKRIITPDPLLPVSGGVGIPKPSTEKRGDLFARAAVFESEGERFAIICARSKPRSPLGM